MSKKSGKPVSPELIITLRQEAERHFSLKDHAQVVRLTRPIVQTLWQYRGTIDYRNIGVTTSLATIVALFLESAAPDDELGRTLRYKLQRTEEAAFWKEKSNTGADKRSQEFMRERMAFLNLG